MPRMVSKRARHASGHQDPAAGRCVQIRAHLKHPAMFQCASRSSRVKFIRRGPGAARGGGGRGPAAGAT
eukprot:6033043-Alexandrium_andersonii.AAC.1